MIGTRVVKRQRMGEEFWQKKILPWEKKLQYDPSLVWDGLYRWFESPNVVRLEDFRDPTEMHRIRTCVLPAAKERARYWAA